MKNKKLIPVPQRKKNSRKEVVKSYKSLLSEHSRLVNFLNDWVTSFVECAAHLMIENPNHAFLKQEWPESTMNQILTRYEELKGEQPMTTASKLVKNEDSLNIVKMHKQLYEKFGIKAPTSPRMPIAADVRMSLNFLLEELLELASASGYSLEFTDEAYGFGRDDDENIEPEKILDALADIQTVLLGVAYRFGLLNALSEKTSVSFFEEAYIRVWLANMRKVRGETKRSPEDLIKPEGWKPPELGDLVYGFLGTCSSCEKPFIYPEENENRILCPTCEVGETHDDDDDS